LQRAGLHLPLQGAGLNGSRGDDVSVGQLVVDVTAGEAIQGERPRTDLGLLLRRQAGHDEPVADIHAELISATSSLGM